MQKYGYVRVSTAEQNTDRQRIALLNYGVNKENIFEDKWTGKDFNRPAYNKMLQVLEAGDLLVIKSVDRLGRNYRDILKQWQYLVFDREINISVIDVPVLDTSENADNLTHELINSMILRLLSYVAETEREFILQRQKEGIAAAKARGVNFGRPNKKVPKKFYPLKEAYLDKKISSRTAGERLGISHTTFLKWVKEN